MNFRPANIAAHGAGNHSITAHGSPSVATLAFEQLATSLLNFPQNDAGTGPVKTIAVLGATSGVGSSTVAINLAHKLARSNKHALVVAVTPENAEDTKNASEKVDLAIEEIENFYYARLPISRLVKNDTLLTDIMRDLEKRFEHVIWDIPPADKSSQSRLICQNVSGVVLVAHAGKTRWRSAKYTVDTLRFAGVNVLGVVLNKKKMYIPRSVYRFLFREDS